jgi:protein TonB
MRRFVLAAAATLFIAVGAPAADHPPPPATEPPPPASPDRTWIQTVTTKKPVVQRPHIDRAQPQPDPQDFYTRELKDAGLEGTAVMRAFVMEDGSILDVVVHKSSGTPQIDDAAKTAVRQMHFVAGTINGSPNPMWAYLQIKFLLEDEEQTVPEDTPK